MTPAPATPARESGASPSIQTTSVSTLDTAVDPDDALRLFVATLYGVYRSLDGGDSWQWLDALENVAPVCSGEVIPPAYAVAVDPHDPARVYAGSPCGGVYFSEDGGLSWAGPGAGMSPNEPVVEILPDPKRPGVIYASSKQTGVFRMRLKYRR